MKKSIVLFQMFLIFSLFFITYSASAQSYNANTSCNCAVEYAKLSEFCKGVCSERKSSKSPDIGDERIDVSEIVIHENISIGTGNPHGNENPWLMKVGPGKSPFLQIGKDGGIGLGTTLFPLHEGNIDLGSNKKPFRQVSALKFAEISDRREKENIIDLTYGLKDVLQLKPVSFTWKSKAIEGTQVGLIAQEVREVIPEIVISQEFTTNDDGNQIALTTDRLSVAYSELVPVLIHAIQEQQQIIEAQKQQLGQQSSTIDNMEATVSQLIEALQSQGIQTQKAKSETGNSK